MKTAFHSAVVLLVFLISILCTYALSGGLRLRIPRTRLAVSITSAWVPWLATGLLLLLQAITFRDIGVALSGDGNLRPWKVVLQMLAGASGALTGVYRRGLGALARRRHVDCGAWGETCGRLGGPSEKRVRWVVVPAEVATLQCM